ncbi:uncharacterized protein [Misgurnus anguillicaudatus]|uniref:uncharacterized protein isoform X1 n=1 Tax=Misgurnus anguillicaudatus TaxID=75329 RepID=UPI003CCFAE71
MEPKPKRPRLCNTDIKAQHSSPHGLLTDVTPPQAQLSPPHRQAPPQASPAQRRAVKRPASLQDDPDEMEPTPKRKRLNGLAAEVTPPPAQTPSSSQQNKADAEEVECSSVSQPSPLQRHMPPPASRRRLWRPAPSSQDEMEPTPKRAKLNRLSAGVTPPPAQTPSSAQQNKADTAVADCSSVSQPSTNNSRPIRQVSPPASLPKRRALKRLAPSTSLVDLYQSPEQNKFN